MTVDSKGARHWTPDSQLTQHRADACLVILANSATLLGRVCCHGRDARVAWELSVVQVIALGLGTGSKADQRQHRDSDIDSDTEPVHRDIVHSCSMRKPLGASTEPRDVTKQMLGYRAFA